MKKIIFTLFFITVINAAVSADTVVFYFWAQNCTACKEAEQFYKKPAEIRDGSSWTYNGIKFVSYRIVDENNKINTKNMKILTDKCDSITRKTGTTKFVYFRRDVYEFYKNKNIPHFRKEDKYSRKDEPFPTPIFATEKKVILGFNNELLQRALNESK